MKLGLGTAQFGLDYGLTNAAGRVPERDVAAILWEAARGGICYIDTAPAYGRAETVLGRLLPAASPLRIITKTRHHPNAANPRPEVQADLEATLRALRRSSVHGLIVHHADDLLGPAGERLWSALEDIKSAGLTAKIGASVYSPDQADALAMRYPLDLIQLPFSLFDQRMLIGGQLARLKARHVEIHARSLLLQGVLLTDHKRLPGFLSPLAPRLRALADAARDCGCSVGDLAIAFPRLVGRIDVGILGVTTLAELKSLLAAMARPVPAIDFHSFAVDDPRLIDPRTWPPAAPRLKKRA
ncbi:MAG: bifunctional regulator KidO [Sphingomonadales bacterium]